jgi:LPXTG-motif cell wall-anchored protein
VEVVVHRGAGMTLHVLHSNIGDAEPAMPQTFAIGSDDQTVTFAVPIGTAGGFVRAELHGQMHVPAGSPTSGYLDMEAMTNPIFLVHGAPPAGLAPVYAPPPSTAPTPPRQSPASPARVASSPELPDTGAGAPAGAAAAALALGAGAAAAAARRRRAAEAMTLYEVTLRAHGGTSLHGRRLRLVGEVTAITADGGPVLTRWLHSCGPAGEAPVSVHLETAEEPAVGAWSEVEATWVPGTGAGGLTPVRMRVHTLRALDEPAPRHEDAHHH